jgi:hypothetical protein
MGAEASKILSLKLRGDGHIISLDVPIPPDITPILLNTDPISPEDLMFGSKERVSNAFDVSTWSTLRELGVVRFDLPPRLDVYWYMVWLDSANSTIVNDVLVNKLPDLRPPQFFLRNKHERSLMERWSNIIYLEPISDRSKKHINGCAESKQDSLDSPEPPENNPTVLLISFRKYKLPPVNNKKTDMLWTSSVSPHEITPESAWAGCRTLSLLKAFQDVSNTGHVVVMLHMPCKDEGDGMMTYVFVKRDFSAPPVDKKNAQCKNMKLVRACLHCKNVRPKLVKCRRCRSAHYCNPKCQKKDWKTHKKSCFAPSDVD